MDPDSVFKTYVEPSLERIPAFQVSHEERHKERRYIILQTVQRNVFTDFDKKLSRHLAATRGCGFPAYTVRIQVFQKGSAAPPRDLPLSHHASVPHALKGIAARLLAHSHCGKAELTIHHYDPGAGSRGSGARRDVTADDIEVMTAALKIARSMGEAEFLSVSGDYDIVMVKPPGEQRPIVMHLINGTLSMPYTAGSGTAPLECPIHGFASHIADDALALSYMAQTRHAMVEIKEDAVMQFRAAAETRILKFDQALAGRPLAGHLLDAAEVLVARLKAGLGDSLIGLSEDAKITALDWSAAIGDSDDHATVADGAPKPAKPYAKGNGAGGGTGTQVAITHSAS